MCCGVIVIESTCRRELYFVGCTLYIFMVIRIYIRVVYLLEYGIVIIICYVCTLGLDFFRCNYRLYLGLFGVFWSYRGFLGFLGR